MIIKTVIDTWGDNNSHNYTLVNGIDQGRVPKDGKLIGYFKWGTDIGLDKDFNTKTEEIYKIDYYL